MANTIDISTVITKTYPIGKENSYNPIYLTITQGNAVSRTYKAEAFNSAPPTRTLPSDLSSVSPVRYWNVTQSPAAAVTSASILINYGPDDGVTDVANLRIAKQNGTSWVNQGGTGSGTPSGSILSTINFTDFSDFVLANGIGGTNPFPVELISFTASVRNNSVLLTWETATEIDNYGFEIEKCQTSNVKSEAWEKIGFVNGHGNSNSPKVYSFEDSRLSNNAFTTDSSKLITMALLHTVTSFLLWLIKCPVVLLSTKITLIRLIQAQRSAGSHQSALGTL